MLYYRRCLDLNDRGKKATWDLGNNWKISGLENENKKQAILRMSFAYPSTWTRRLLYGLHPHFLPCGWLLRLVSTGHLLSPVLPKLHTEKIPSLCAEDCGFKSTIKGTMPWDFAAIFHSDLVINTYSIYGSL